MFQTWYWYWFQTNWKSLDFQVSCCSSILRASKMSMCGSVVSGAFFFLWSNMCGQPQFLSCWKWSVVKFGCYLIEQIEGKWLSWIMMVLWCIFDLQITDVYWWQCKKNHTRDYKPTCSGLYSSMSFFKPLGSSLWTTGRKPLGLDLKITESRKYFK